MPAVLRVENIDREVFEGVRELTQSDEMDEITERALDTSFAAVPRARLASKLGISQLDLSIFSTGDQSPKSEDRYDRAREAEQRYRQDFYAAVEDEIHRVLGTGLIADGIDIREIDRFTWYKNDSGSVSLSCGENRLIRGGDSMLEGDGEADGLNIISNGGDIDLCLEEVKGGVLYVYGGGEVGAYLGDLNESARVYIQAHGGINIEASTVGPRSELIVRSEEGVDLSVCRNDGVIRSLGKRKYLWI